MKSLSRDALEAEVLRLQDLLRQAGIDARLSHQKQLKRNAQNLTDISISRAQTAAVRNDSDSRVARAATIVAEAQRDHSADLVAELRASQARLDTVIEAVPVGILLAEAPSGRIIMGNGRTEEVLGHPPIYASGTNGYAAYTGLHADGRPLEPGEWPLARIVSGSVDHAELDVRYRRPGGSLTWISVTGEAIKDDDGTTVGAVVVFRNIDDRKAAEAAQDLLNRELSHRLKNTLAMVQSIAAQTLRNAPSLPVAQETLAARLVALGKSHDMLLAGHADSASVTAVVQGAIALHEDTAIRFRVSGPCLLIGPSAALMLGLVLHELATNAAKYGALSAATGTVAIEWSVVGEGEAAEFCLDWIERGGPPVSSPTRKGFGSRLIERGLGGGKVTIAYPIEGLTCTISVPLAGFRLQDEAIEMKV